VRLCSGHWNNKHEPNQKKKKKKEEEEEEKSSVDLMYYQHKE
jgi:hypothetical protein